MKEVLALPEHLNVPVLRAAREFHNVAGNVRLFLS